MDSQEEIYASNEMVHFPYDWDENTRNHMKFMLKEAFRAGREVGYALGEGTGKGISIQLLYDVINKLQDTK